jgi:hypothetical protein
LFFAKKKQKLGIFYTKNVAEVIEQEVQDVLSLGHEVSQGQDF